MSEDKQLQSFKPVIPESPRVLILGSMPGVESLKQQQYYAHPSNAFWYCISSLSNMMKPPKEYSERIGLLHLYHIALWDVCCNCNRDGSLDSNIKNVKPNAINELLKEHDTIKLVLFNGTTVQSLFKKYFKYMDNVEYICMPSTSPTNARMKRADKVEKWKSVLYPICIDRIDNE